MRVAPGGVLQAQETGVQLEFTPSVEAYLVLLPRIDDETSELKQETDVFPLGLVRPGGA